MSGLGRVVACALLLGGLLAGCGGSEQQRGDIFDRTLRGYENALRWGEYEMAAAAVRPQQDTAATPPDPQALAGIRVTSLSSQRTPLGGEPPQVLVEADIAFYHDETGAVHQLRDRQLWWYDEALRRWYLDGGLPDFKGALRATRR